MTSLRLYHGPAAEGGGGLLQAAHRNVRMLERFQIGYDLLSRVEFPPTPVGDGCD